MGVYYRLVNLQKREAIEPGKIGGGGVKHRAVVNGDAARMLAYLHIYVDSDWTVMGDDDHDLTDATEAWVGRFNLMYPDDKISMCGDDE